MKNSESKTAAAHYVKIVEWSADDGCFVGTCPGLMFGGVHGDDEAKVYAELCQAAEEVIALLKEERHRLPPPTPKKKFNGKVLLRLDPAVHQRVALLAEANGESLNALVTRKLVTT